MRGYSAAVAMMMLAGRLAAADAQRGAMVAESQGCMNCHTVQGQGVGHEMLRPARDLSGKLTAKYTPAALASVLWNHQPGMWQQLAAARIEPAAASEADWQDLFAYLYALQFQDLPGEAGRGAKAFAAKGCGGCHGADAAAERRAAPVKEWQNVGDPVALLYQMWTHAATMDLRQRMTGGAAWQKLSGRDLMDLTAYAQAGQRLSPNTSFRLPAGAEGRIAYEARCSRCHQGAVALERRLGNATWMELGAALWNHAPQMPSGAATTEAEMRQLLAYVWELQYAGAPGGGNSVVGGRTFREKGCINCHKDETTGAPKSPRMGFYSPYTMVAMGWGRGRVMHQQMLAGGGKWPKLSAVEMADLAAFLNALR